MVARKSGVRDGGAGGSHRKSHVLRHTLCTLKHTHTHTHTHTHARTHPHHTHICFTCFRLRTHLSICGGMEHFIFRLMYV